MASRVPSGASSGDAGIWVIPVRVKQDAGRHPASTAALNHVTARILPGEGDSKKSRFAVRVGSVGPVHEGNRRMITRKGAADFAASASCP